MFSDLFETLRNRWRSTGKPALQSLLAEKRSLVSTFAVLLLLETLLCILLLSYANGQRAEQQMQGEIAIFGMQAEQLGSGEWLTQAVSELSARGERAAEMNRTMFVLALLVWAGASYFVTARLIASSVELKKFIYGLYITFGANTRKIRSLIFWQMMMLGLAALVPSVPLALLVCRGLYGYLPGGGQLARGILLALGLSALLLILVIATVARRTTAKTCISLLSAADVSDYVRTPRRSRRNITLDSPRRLAGIAVRRMRGYYASLVLSAVLPACIFFCCMSLARSDELRQASPVEEYSLHFAGGFGSVQYREQLAPSLAAISGVAGTSIDFADHASTAGFHMLLSAEQVLKPEDLVASYEGQAFDGIQLLSADEYSLREKNLCITYGETAPEASENGIVPYGIYPVEEGTALMAYPRSVYSVFPLQGYTMRFLPDSRVFIPLFDETQTGRSLEERATDTTRPGVSLTVTQITVNDCYISGNFFANRLDGEYLILNPADFKKVTGIDSEANAKLGIATPAVSLSEIGSYLCGGAGRAGQESVYHAPMYAGNGFDVTVGDEAARARYGLPGDAVLPAAPGEVTLLLRPTSDLSPELEQIQLSGVTVLDDVDLTSPEGFALTDTELLQKAINELPQYYQSYRVCSVIVTDRVEADTLLMQEDDLAALFGRNGAYTELRVSVMPDMDIEGVCSLLTSLYGWAEVTPVGGSHPTLTQNGVLWDALIITGFRYNQLLRAIALLLFLAVPFVWFCQQYNHYRKRKTDLEILLSLGQTRAMLRRVFLWEGLLLALFSALAVLIVCPLLTLAAYGVLAFNGFPFDYSSFDFISLFAAVAFSVLCAMLSALLNDRILFPPRKQSKKPGAPSASGTALPEQV